MGKQTETIGHDLRANTFPAMTGEDEFATFKRLREIEEMKDPLRSEKLERDQLIDKIVRSNIRFTVKLAGSYTKKQVLPVDDLIAAGMLGMMEAIDLFDYTKGVKFLTFAVWLMRNRMHEAIVNDLGTTSYFATKTRQMDRDMRADEQSSQRSCHLAQKLEDNGIPPGDMDSFNFVHGEHFCLSEIVPGHKEEGSLLWQDIIADENAPTAESIALGREREEAISSALDRLSDKRKAYIVRRKMGLDGVAPMRFESIGLDVGLTGERVRQVFEVAIEEMRDDQLLADAILPI